MLQVWLGSCVAVTVGRPAAVAPVQPLAWEPPYASDVALKTKNQKNPTPHKLLDVVPCAIGRLSLFAPDAVVHIPEPQAPTTAVFDTVFPSMALCVPSLPTVDRDDLTIFVF